MDHADTAQTDINNAAPQPKRRVLDSIDSDALFARGRILPQIADLENVGILMNSRRNTQNTLRGIASACIDEDDSGTYVPDEEKPKSSRAQTKRTRKVKGNFGRGEINQSKDSREDETKNRLSVAHLFKTKPASDDIKSASAGHNDDGDSITPEVNKTLSEGRIVSSLSREPNTPRRLNGEETRYGSTQKWEQ